MVAAKTGMQSVQVFQTYLIIECRCERVRRQPAAHICKQASNSRDHHADRGEPHDQTRSS